VTTLNDSFSGEPFVVFMLILLILTRLEGMLFFPQRARKTRRH
jgi:hypothetical protein